MQIWNRHYRECRAPVEVLHGVFDACVLSKPFFRADEFLIFEKDGEPVGFLHLGYGGSSDGHDRDSQRPLICALCVEPHPQEDEIADALLETALSRLKAAGASNVIAIGSPMQYSFYLGMAPGDGLMGVVARDIRLQRWLTKQSFEPIRPTECWEVDLGSFRPPMDRSQFSLRRSTSVVRVLDEQHRSWWDAVVLGHTEQIRFQLLSRADSSISDSAQFWFIDTSFAGIASNTARLWISDFPEDPEARDRMTYLLAEAFRQLQSERFTTIRAIATPDQASSVAIFQRLGFRSVEPGLIFERRWT
jgi:GNAT superfamily N-acetyltransferase